MRGGIIFSSFRRISRAYPRRSSGFRPSPLAAQRYGWSKRGIATSENLPREKVGLTQNDDLICPVKFFKEVVPLLQSFDANSLLQTVGGVRGKSIVAWKAGKTIRSLPELIAKYHALGCGLGKTLRLENLRISRSSQRFTFLDTSAIQPVENVGSLLKDWNLAGDSLNMIAARVLGEGTPYPKDLKKYIANMRSAAPKVRRLLYNSLFLPPRARYWLRLYVDQMSRKDYDSLPRATKRKIQEFFGKLPYQGGVKDVGSLAWLSEKEEFISAAMAEARKDAQNRVTGPNYLNNEEARKRDLGRWVVCVNRDGLMHGTKTKGKYLDKIKRAMLTAENILQLLHVEFDELDQAYIDLCDEHDELWVLLSIEEIFFESPETWRLAIEALRKDIEGVQELDSKK